MLCLSATSDPPSPPSYNGAFEKSSGSSRFASVCEIRGQRRAAAAAAFEQVDMVERVEFSISLIDDHTK